LKIYHIFSYAGYCHWSFLSERYAWLSDAIDNSFAITPRLIAIDGYCIRHWLSADRWADFHAITPDTLRRHFRTLAIYLLRHWYAAITPVRIRHCRHFHWPFIIDITINSYTIFAIADFSSSFDFIIDAFSIFHYFRLRHYAAIVDTISHWYCIEYFAIDFHFLNITPTLAIRYYTCHWWDIFSFLHYFRLSLYWAATLAAGWLRHIGFRRIFSLLSIVFSFSHWGRLIRHWYAIDYAFATASFSILMLFKKIDSWQLSLLRRQDFLILTCRRRCHIIESA